GGELEVAVRPGVRKAYLDRGERGLRVSEGVERPREREARRSLVSLEAGDVAGEVQGGLRGAVGPQALASEEEAGEEVTRVFRHHGAKRHEPRALRARFGLGLRHGGEDTRRRSPRGSRARPGVRAASPSRGATAGSRE